MLMVRLLSVESLSGRSNPAVSRILLLFRFAWPGMSFLMPLEPDLLLSSRLEFLLKSFGECSLVESVDFRRPWVLLVSLLGSWIEVRLRFVNTFLIPRGDISGDISGDGIAAWVAGSITTSGQDRRAVYERQAVDWDVDAAERGVRYYCTRAVLLYEYGIIVRVRYRNSFNPPVSYQNNKPGICQRDLWQSNVRKAGIQT